MIMTGAPESSSEREPTGTRCECGHIHGAPYSKVRAMCFLIGIAWKGCERADVHIFPSPPTVAHLRWTSTRIGSGKDSVVWLGEGVEKADEALVAIKEFDCWSTSAAVCEWGVYQAIWAEGDNVASFARLHNALTYDVGPPRRTVLVLDYIGPTLSQLRRACNLRKMPLSARSISRLWITLIDRIEHVHRCGYLLRYVKAANICVGGQNLDTLFVIDFASAKRYIDDDRTHKARDPSEGKGNYLLQSVNAKYGSRNSDKALTPSRCDDMESAAYAMIDMLGTKRLEWIDCKDKEAASRKRQITFEQLSRGHEAIVRYFEAVSLLDYDEKPDCGLLRLIISDLGSCGDQPGPGTFEWHRLKDDSEQVSS